MAAYLLDVEACHRAPAESFLRTRRSKLPTGTFGHRAGSKRRLGVAAGCRTQESDAEPAACVTNRSGGLSFDTSYGATR